jgi:hypothetical protein
MGGMIRPRRTWIDQLPDPGEFYREWHFQNRRLCLSLPLTSASKAVERARRISSCPDPAGGEDPGPLFDWMTVVVLKNGNRL